MERNNRGEFFRYRIICLATILYLSHCFINNRYVYACICKHIQKKTLFEDFFLFRYHYPFFYVL